MEYHAADLPLMLPRPCAPGPSNPSQELLPTVHPMGSMHERVDVALLISDSPVTPAWTGNLCNHVFRACIPTPDAKGRLRTPDENETSHAIGSSK